MIIAGRPAREIKKHSIVGFYEKFFNYVSIVMYRVIVHTFRATVGWLVVCSEGGSCYFSQAAFILLYSSDPPASAFCISGTIGLSIATSTERSV